VVEYDFAVTSGIYLTRKLILATMIVWVIAFILTN